MTNARENIIRKITALLAKAEGTDNELEAASFMAKVNELLEKHQVELYELGSSEDKMGRQVGTFNMYASMSWAKLLVSQIARFYSAETLWWKTGNHLRYEVIGRESNRITAELMIPFIVAQVRSRAGVLSRATGKTRAIAEREIGHALSVRIHNEILKDETRRAEHAKNMLVPVDEVQAYLNAEVAHKPGRDVKIKTSESARDHASKIAIQRQAPNAKGTLQIGN